MAPALATVKRAPAKKAGASTSRKTTNTKTTSTRVRRKTQTGAAIASTQDAIAKLAYGYWQARGFEGGDPMEDWLRAEAEYRNTGAA